MEIAKVVSVATRVHETIWLRYKTKLFLCYKIQIPHLNNKKSELYIFRDNLDQYGQQIHLVSALYCTI